MKDKKDDKISLLTNLIKQVFAFTVGITAFTVGITLLITNFKNIIQPNFDEINNGKVSLDEALSFEGESSILNFNHSKLSKNAWDKYYSFEVSTKTNCNNDSENSFVKYCKDTLEKERIKANIEARERERIIENLPPYAIDYIVCDDCGHKGTLIIRSLKKNLTQKECSDLLKYVPTEYLDPEYTKYDEKEVWTAPDGYFPHFDEQGIHMLTDRWGHQIAMGIERSGIRILDGDMLCSTER